jgi:tape measure domain-containing protein
VAVANVAIEVDARGAVQQLKNVNTQALATAGGLQKLSADALRVKAAVESQQGGFTKASQLQGVFAANVKNTETAIRAQIAALRDVQSRVQIGGALYQKAATQIAQYQSILDRANKTENQAQRSIGGLASSIGQLAGAYVSLRIAQEAVQAGIKREESTRRLQFLAKGYAEVTQAQLAASRAGKQFGLSATESNQQFAQLYGRLRPLNVSLSDIEAAFVGFNTAAKVSGATTAESAGALLQLTQALGSGVLRGQELNSVLEQSPGLVVALTRELNAPVSQIRKLAEEGKITSDVVIRALKRAGSEGADKLAAAMEGPAQQIKNLQNEFENFQVAVVQNVLPAVVGSIKLLTEILQQATQYVKDFGVGWSYITSAVSAAVAPFQGILNVLGEIDGRLRSIGQAPGLRILAGLLPGGPLGPILGAPAAIGAGMRRNAQGSGMYGRYGAPESQVPFMPRTAAPRPPAVPTAADGKGRKGGKSDAERAAEAAAKEAERVTELIRGRIAEGQIIRINSELKDKVAAAEMAGDKMLAARLKGQQREVDLQYRYAQELANETSINAQKAIIFEAQNALVANQRDVQRELNELQNQGAKNQIVALESLIGRTIELTDQQKQQKELADGIANTVGQGMTSAFDSLIQGSEDFGTSLRKIASGVLIDIANQLLRVFVIQKAINAISSLFGGVSPASPTTYAGVKINPLTVAGLPSFRAIGGSVTGGQPYVVGERGPELFMPGRSGGIAPAGSFGGGVSVVVNVDAKGTSVEGNQQQGAALGRAVSAAVQAELIKQQRPGGLLAR